MKLENLNTWTKEELEAAKLAIAAELQARIDTTKIIVSMPTEGDSRRKIWTKRITGVDQTQTTGYCFQGNFVKAGKQELPLGAVILHWYTEGSQKNHDCIAKVYRVTADGLEDTGIMSKRDNRETGGWALDIRDKVAELF